METVMTRHRGDDASELTKLGELVQQDHWEETS